MLEIQRMKRSALGVTLVELMIVLAILSIIVAVAYPSYAAYTERTRRADGQTTLLNAAQALERCYTQNNTYVGCAFPAVSPDGFYAIAATVQTVTAFTLTATPQGQQANDTGCAVLSLTHIGVRNSSGTKPVERCW
jgi:type IV pilus assembly protein PilE